MPCGPRSVSLLFVTLGLLAVILAPPSVAQPRDLPSPPDDHVLDEANMLSDEEEQALARKLIAYRDTSSISIVVVTLTSLDGVSLEDYATSLRRDWGIGEGEGKDNEMVVLASNEDDEMFIDTGERLHESLPDAVANWTVRNVMRPLYQKGRPYESLARGTEIITRTTSLYDGLVESSEAVEQAWTVIQAAYQRRADLVPSLVETAKSAADIDPETLNAVMEAQAKSTSIEVGVEELNDSRRIRQYQQVQAALSESLRRLLAVSENHSELQANQKFGDLRSQLEGAENRITVARRDYNNAVRQHNKQIRSSFAATIIASLEDFETKVFFEAGAGADQAPDVSFDD